MISLIVGSLYLGLAAGLGFEKTLTAIVEGFGSIMAEVGLLIGFGVLMGSLLFAMDALQRLVELLLGCSGHAGCRMPWPPLSPRSSPRSMSTSSWSWPLRWPARPPRSSAATVSG